MTPSERLDATFLALADPTRRAILARLADGEASVAQLAAPFEISQPFFSSATTGLACEIFSSATRGRSLSATFSSEASLSWSNGLHGSIPMEAMRFTMGASSGAGGASLHMSRVNIVK